MKSTSRQAVQDLTGLVPLLEQSEGFADVISALDAGTEASIDGAWGSSCALTIAAVANHADGPLLVVLPRISDVDDFALDLAGFSGSDPTVFPAWESLPREHDVSDEVFGGRLRALQALRGDLPPKLIVTSFPAILQPVPDRGSLERGTRVLRVGDEIDTDQLLHWLVDCGFVRVPAIEVPGEFCVHGGIVDVFPPAAEDPLRLEFFGDELESMRRFDVETQRKLEDVEQVDITIVAPLGQSSNADSSENAVPAGDAGVGESFLEALPDNTSIVLSELQDLVDEGKHYLARLEEQRGLYSVDSTLKRCAAFPLVTVSAIGGGSAPSRCQLQIESIERFSRPRNEALDELASAVDADDHVLICCHNDGERERLSEILTDSQIEIGSGVELCVGTITRGFRLVADQLVVLCDHELFGRVDIRRPSRRRRVETRAIDNFLDLGEGDLVVHLTHGIGRFRGMQLLESDGQAEEHLAVEFRDGLRVLVPVSLIHLVQKYVGAARTAPRLSKVGGTSWSKKKQKVADAIRDMASEMIRLQAARESKPGIAFPTDSHWQHEFDSSFPYTETPDQLDSIADVKEDMMKNRPMDRLICGDVGYGKTEVGMRAAFKTIDAGRQVAVLVPTTVLAEQHFRTFCERMAEYPVNIEVLSRFKSKAEQRDVLMQMMEGTVDIVIGTHRLVQKDIRFKDLGLLIIDEEQRFGVEAKEMLKRLRLEVDVLTLSATPIPRTLHMSLLGIRDISNLVTAPQDRQAIDTRICAFDRELIRRAIVRELNRNGQVYFVHNRVYNIRSIADIVQSIVPEARVGIGHGQMAGAELEQAMLDFVERRTDVLVCTTIIESGLDIPNANTIIIHHADKFGLADLHQLRGRVGRYKHRAYCYLMLGEGNTITSTGAKRLKVIEEFSELGAGFKIAMRDLEIRGAGNILGTEQSGHISAVGYEMYCQLVENAVRRLKNEPQREQVHVAIDLPVAAYIPDDYIPPGRQKIEMYRKLSLVTSTADLLEVQHEFEDRFGPPPAEVTLLISVRQLQLSAWAWRIDDIHLEDRFAVLSYNSLGTIRKLANSCDGQLRVVDANHAYLVLPESIGRDGSLVEHLKTVLQSKQ